jgi:hypothetical protein
MSTTTTHRVRTPPICTLSYANALSKGNRAFALRGGRSNRAARTTEANEDLRGTNSNFLDVSSNVETKSRKFFSDQLLMQWVTLII